MCFSFKGCSFQEAAVIWFQQPEGQHLDLLPPPPDDGLLGKRFCPVPFHFILWSVCPPSVLPPLG